VRSVNAPVGSIRNRSTRSPIVSATGGEEHAAGGEGRDGDESDEESDKYRGGEAREGGEHGEGGEGEKHDEGEGDGEESGAYIERGATRDAIRRGARLVLSFDPASNAFVGTVENTTEATMCAV
jgi:hypothetical protein